MKNKAKATMALICISLIISLFVTTPTLARRGEGESEGSSGSGSSGNSISSGSSGSSDSSVGGSSNSGSTNNGSSGSESRSGISSENSGSSYTEDNGPRDESGSDSSSNSGSSGNSGSENRGSSGSSEGSGLSENRGSSNSGSTSENRGSSSSESKESDRHERDGISNDSDRHGRDHIEDDFDRRGRGENEICRSDDLRSEDNSSSNPGNNSHERFFQEIEVRAFRFNGATQIKIEVESISNNSISEGLALIKQLTRDDVDRLLRIENKEVNIRDDLDIDIELENGIKIVKSELRFPVNATEKEGIVNAIMDKISSLEAENMGNISVDREDMNGTLQKIFNLLNLLVENDTQRHGNDLINDHRENETEIRHGENETEIHKTSFVGMGFHENEIRFEAEMFDSKHDHFGTAHFDNAGEDRVLSIEVQGMKQMGLGNDDVLNVYLDNFHIGDINLGDGVLYLDSGKGDIVPDINNDSRIKIIGRNSVVLSGTFKMTTV